jgi:hypothetical protein
VVEVDPVVGYAELAQPVALRGEVLFVGGAARPNGFEALALLGMRAASSGLTVQSTAPFRGSFGS